MSKGPRLTESLDACSSVITAAAAATAAIMHDRRDERTVETPLGDGRKVLDAGERPVDAPDGAGRTPAQQSRRTDRIGLWECLVHQTIAVVVQPYPVSSPVRLMCNERRSKDEHRSRGSVPSQTSAAGKTTWGHTER